MRAEGPVASASSWPRQASWETALDLLQPIWDFMRLSHRLTAADAIVAFGSNDLSTARYAANLYHQGLASIVVMSGGVAHQSDLLATGWEESEAHKFADTARGLGVPNQALMLEDRASNTLENFTFVRELLDKHGFSLTSAIVVHKPFMERRAYATGRLAWPDIPLIVTSVPCSLQQYLFFNTDPVSAINVMLGDLQRVQVYGEKGMLERQAIPGQVLENFQRLIRLGFDRHLLAE
jgi:uncharacterized SAM-binding protein YcdF (DUF218 family)